MNGLIKSNKMDLLISRWGSYGNQIWKLEEGKGLYYEL